MSVRNAPWINEIQIYRKKNGNNPNNYLVNDFFYSRAYWTEKALGVRMPSCILNRSSTEKNECHIGCHFGWEPIARAQARAYVFFCMFKRLIVDVGKHNPIFWCFEMYKFKNWNLFTLVSVCSNCCCVGMLVKHMPYFVQTTTRKRWHDITILLGSC